MSEHELEAASLPAGVLNFITTMDAFKNIVRVSIGYFFKNERIEFAKSAFEEKVRRCLDKLQPEESESRQGKWVNEVMGHFDKEASAPWNVYCVTADILFHEPTALDPSTKYVEMNLDMVLRYVARMYVKVVRDRRSELEKARTWPGVPRPVALPMERDDPDPWKKWDALQEKEQGRRPTGKLDTKVVLGVASGELVVRDVHQWGLMEDLANLASAIEELKEWCDITERFLLDHVTTSSDNREEVEREAHNVQMLVQDIHRKEGDAMLGRYDPFVFIRLWEKWTDVRSSLHAEKVRDSMPSYTNDGKLEYVEHPFHMYIEPLLAVAGLCGDGVLTLAARDTIARVEAVIRAITWEGMLKTSARNMFALEKKYATDRRHDVYVRMMSEKFLAVTRAYAMTWHLCNAKQIKVTEAAGVFAAALVKLYQKKSEHSENRSNVFERVVRELMFSEKEAKRHAARLFRLPEKQLPRHPITPDDMPIEVKVARWMDWCDWGEGSADTPWTTEFRVLLERVAEALATREKPNLVKRGGGERAVMLYGLALVALEFVVSLPTSTEGKQTLAASSEEGGGGAAAGAAAAFRVVQALVHTCWKRDPEFVVDIVHAFASTYEVYGTEFAAAVKPLENALRPLDVTYVQDAMTARWAKTMEEEARKQRTGRFKPSLPPLVEMVGRLASPVSVDVMRVRARLSAAVVLLRNGEDDDD